MHHQRGTTNGLPNDPRPYEPPFPWHRGSEKRSNAVKLGLEQLQARQQSLGGQHVAGLAALAQS